MEEIKEPTQWTDKDALDFYTDHLDQLQTNIINRNKDIYYLDNSNQGVIAIYARNKIVELFKEYRDKNVAFANSLIPRVVLSYFDDIFDDAYNKKQERNEFNRLSNIIREFELEKDIEIAVADYISLMSSTNNPYFSAKETIDTVNEELEKLGYDKKIIYSDPYDQYEKPKRVRM